MPRNVGGLYSLPAGSIVTDGVDDILASQHNTPLLDITADLNAARPIVAGGTGATTVSGAQTNLGLAPFLGSPFQTDDIDLAVYSAPTGDQFIVTAGDVVDVPGVGAYTVLASGAASQDETNANGVKLNYIQPADVVATRAALKSSEQYIRPVFLAESGREGHFVYDPDITIAEHQADALEQEFVAPNPAADGAWRLTGGPRGVNVVDAPTRTTSFTVTAIDMGVLQICNPTAGATLDVTLPAAANFVGKTIAFLVPAGTSGRVRFLATPGQGSSLVSDFQTDAFWIWHKESVTLLATASKWEILDWQKNPLLLTTSGPASNTALSTTGVAVEIDGWIAPAFDATHLRHYRWALDGGSPQKVIVPRRGRFQVEFSCFINWTGTAPTALYCIMPNAGGSGIAHRQQADFIQPTTPTQAVIRYRSIAQNNPGTILAPLVYCTGGTGPQVAGATGAPEMRLTEIV